MRKITSSFLILSIFSNIAFADCDFSTGIVPGPNNTFIYSEACHKRVGKLVQDNKVMTAQIEDLTKAIQLKDLALVKADERTELWMKTSDQLTDRITKIDETVKHSEWWYFGFGVLATVGAGYVASQVYRH